MTPLKAPSSTTTHNPSHPANNATCLASGMTWPISGMTRPIQCRHNSLLLPQHAGHQRNPSYLRHNPFKQQGPWVTCTLCLLWWLTLLSAVAAYSLCATHPARHTSGPANGACTLPFGCLHLAKLQQGSSPWPNQQLNMPIAAKPNRSMTQFSRLAVQPNQPTAHCHIANTILLLFLFLLQGHKNKLKFEEQVFESCTCLS